MKSRLSVEAVVGKSLARLELRTFCRGRQASTMSCDVPGAHSYTGETVELQGHGDQWSCDALQRGWPPGAAAAAGRAGEFTSAVHHDKMDRTGEAVWT